MTFAAPLFLLAALAVAIPLLLHMVNRQKAPVLPFSTLRFLRLSAQRTRRRKYLHDVLLLLLRVAALLLIALALAKPTVRHLRGLPGVKAATAAVVILDNSASMGMRDQSGPRWEAALQACRLLLEQFGDRDQLALLLPCGPARPELGRLYRNQDVVRQGLNDAQLSYERADLPAQLQTARRLLEDADATHKEVYLITDMQAAAWTPLSEDVAPEDVVPEEASQIPLVLVDVHSQPLPNVAVGAVELQGAAPITGVPFQAEVQLHGDLSTTQQRHLELVLNGEKQQVSPTLTIEPGGTSRHVFQIQLQTPGLHRGEIRLDGEDACSLDDRAYFALVVDPQVPVAVVKPSRHEIPYLEDTYYLQRALLPLPADQWAIRVTELTPTELATARLEDYAVVYCVNLPAPAPAATSRLHRYLRNGGHVVWFYGDNVNPQAYALSDRQVDNELLPSPLISLREPDPERPDGWQVGWLDETHPALGPLVQPPSLYQSVLVYRHMQMQSPGQGGRVLARLSDGEPLLVSRDVGAGSVHAFGISAHVDWSNLPLRPLFLPLIARTTFYLAEADARQPQLVAGTPLVSPATSGAPYQIVLPSGETVQQSSEDSQTMLRFNDTHEVGIYQLRTMAAQHIGPSVFAFNLDPAELPAEPLPREQLQERLGKQPLLFCDGVENVAESVRQLREGNSLRGLFLLAVLLALVGESFLANRLVTRQQRLPQHRARPQRRMPKRLTDFMDLPP